MALNEAHVQGQIPGASSTRKSLCAAKSLEVLQARRHAAEVWMTFHRTPEEGTLVRAPEVASRPREPRKQGAVPCRLAASASRRRVDGT